jgi:hypothetical protein
MRLRIPTFEWALRGVRFKGGAPKGVEMRRAQVFFFWKRVETSFARPVPSTGRVHLVEAEVPRFLRVSKYWRNAGLLRVKVMFGDGYNDKRRGFRGGQPVGG